MNILFHELKQNKLAIIIWSVVISFMLGVCVIIYPEMANQMNEISNMFADMGSFSAAFGMDQINFGEFIGYFGIECGNVLGLGGAFFAAITGITILAKEERDNTAEFLLTHPVSRNKVIIEKLLSVVAQILILNLSVASTVALTILIIGEEVKVLTIVIILLSYLILQIEIAAITFGISAFIKGQGLGIGLGIAFLLYFLNIFSNLTDEVKFLKYITPFSYTDSAYIINNDKLEIKYLIVGLVLTIGGILAGFIKYNKKDIN